MNIRPNIPATPVLNPEDDYTSETGAYRIAAKVREYWARRSLFPKVWVAKTLTLQSTTDRDRIVYMVRSDMKNGRPQ